MLARERECEHASRSRSLICGRMVRSVFGILFVLHLYFYDVIWHDIICTDMVHILHDGSRGKWNRVVCTGVLIPHHAGRDNNHNLENNFLSIYVYSGAIQKLLTTLDRLIG